MQLAAIFFIYISGFDLTTRDSYFTILVEVFTKTHSRKHIFHESHRVNRTHDYGLASIPASMYQITQQCHNFKNILIDDFQHHVSLSGKSFVKTIFYGPKITN